VIRDNLTIASIGRRYGGPEASCKDRTTTADIRQYGDTSPLSFVTLLKEAA
jgi:hypothetical protein